MKGREEGRGRERESSGATFRIRIPRAVGYSGINACTCTSNIYTVGSEDKLWSVTTKTQVLPAVAMTTVTSCLMTLDAPHLLFHSLLSICPTKQEPSAPDNSVFLSHFAFKSVWIGYQHMFYIIAMAHFYTCLWERWGTSDALGRINVWRCAYKSPSILSKTYFLCTIELLIIIPCRVKSDIIIIIIIIKQYI